MKTKVKTKSKPAKRKATKATEKARPSIRAIYDAAQDSVENANHWASADALDANSSMTLDTRERLRDRSRYEADNNAYYRGVLESLADDMVGTIPRLHLTIPNDPERIKAKAIETAYRKWAMSIGLGDKLRLLDKSRRRDGECFALMYQNAKIPERGLTDITLDLRLYETDQISDPTDYGQDPRNIDGVHLDENGEVSKYTVLKEHPGSSFTSIFGETMEVEARWMLHWFRPTRPGQARGVPEFQSALPLFAQLRRFTLATLTAAETAAMLAGIITNSTPPDSSGAESSYDATTFDRIPMVRGMLLSLLNGQQATQFKPEQPTSTYKEFKGELLNEIGRCGSVPFNVIAGNSSGYNYSSGRLDHTIYHRGIKVERFRFRERILDPLFIVWVDEAAIAGEIPPGLPEIWEWSWTWNYDGFMSIDPLKEANANKVKLETGQTNLAQIHAETDGEYWEDSLTQRAAELAFMRQNNIPTESTPVPPMPTDALEQLQEAA